MSTSWEETSTISNLRAEQMAKPGTVFRHQRHLYRTLGQHISNGGMGQVYALERLAPRGNTTCLFVHES